MWSQRVALILAACVSLSFASARPAQSVPDEPVGDKLSEIEGLRNLVPTPEDAAQEAALLAEEQHRIAYEAVAVPAVSPGIAISDDGGVVLWVYQGVDVETVEAALSLSGLEASVVTSRYTLGENQALTAALRAIDLERDEAFGFGYDAITDIITISGSVPAATVRDAVGERLPYEFRYGAASRVGG